MHMFYGKELVCDYMVICGKSNEYGKQVPIKIMVSAGHLHCQSGQSPLHRSHWTGILCGNISYTAFIFRTELEVNMIRTACASILAVLFVRTPLRQYTQTCAKLEKNTTALINPYLELHHKRTCFTYVRKQKRS